MVKALTDEEKAAAKPVIDTFTNLCLMKGFFGKDEVAFVCRVEMEGEIYNLVPLFIVLTEKMKDACRNCNGEALSSADIPDGDDDEVHRDTQEAK